MGVKLVDRTTRRVELTIAGAEVVATIGRLIDEIDRMTNDMRDVASGRRGRVRLGATPLLASTSLPSIIASFSERNPGVETSLFDATADALLAKLRAGELDLVIATYEGIATDIEAQVLFSDSMMLVCAATHPQSGLVSLPWRSLQNERLVQLAVGSGLRALTDRTLREIGISIAPTQEVTQVSTALALVEAGLGVAVLPSHAISTLNAAQLKALPLVEPVVLRDVSLLRHQQRSMSPAASAMHHYLMAQRHRMATYLDGKP